MQHGIFIHAPQWFRQWLGPPSQLASFAEKKVDVFGLVMKLDANRAGLAPTVVLELVLLPLDILGCRQEVVQQHSHAHL